jgi:hypothetical protein
MTLAWHRGNLVAFVVTGGRRFMGSRLDSALALLVRSGGNTERSVCLAAVFGAVVGSTIENGAGQGLAVGGVALGGVVIVKVAQKAWERIRTVDFRDIPLPNNRMSTYAEMHRFLTEESNFVTATLDDGLGRYFVRGAGEARFHRVSRQECERITQRAATEGRFVHNVTIAEDGVILTTRLGGKLHGLAAHRPAVLRIVPGEGSYVLLAANGKQSEEIFRPEYHSPADPSEAEPIVETESHTAFAV